MEISSNLQARTLHGVSRFSGIALHTGVRAHMALKPGAPGEGIVFERIDLPGRPRIRALVENVVDVRRGTTIAEGKGSVCTVEHVLAALHASGIDDALVEMDGPEPPVGDGSALPYLSMIEEAGVVDRDIVAEVAAPNIPIVIEDGDTKLVLTPAEEFKITYIIAFGATPLDAQFISLVVNADSFAHELAGARTFCLYRELEQMIAMGLVKGGSLDNAVVIHDGAIISKDGLRWPNELVRHKVLDLIGDLYLVGSRIQAHIIAVKSGHPTNVRLAGAIREQMATACKA